MIHPATGLAPLLFMALALPAQAFIDPLVGEWSNTAEQCRSVRLTFTADQQHQALLYQNDQWLEARSRPFARDGRKITVAAGEQPTLLHIEWLDAEHLTLRNDDRRQTGAHGSDRLELVRCPGRS